MGAVACSVRIAAPVSRVFALATDLAQMPQRIPDIKRVEVLTPGPVGVGTRFRETRVMFGKEATEEMNFAAFEPDRAYTITCQSCGSVYESSFRFVPDTGGTRVDMSFDARPVTLMARLMSPLAFFAKGMVRKCVLRDLEALKRAAEGSPDALPVLRRADRFGVDGRGIFAGVFDLREEALLLLEGRGGVLEAARKLSRLMREGQVDAAVIGGVAVVLHGHVRTTRDVDLLVRQSLDSVRVLLESAGASYRPEQREFVLDGVPVYLVDQALAQPLPRETVEIEAVTTVSLPDLINLKLRSGLADVARAQDLADVIGLIRHHRLGDPFAGRIERSMRADFRRLSKAALR